MRYVKLLLVLLVVASNTTPNALSKIKWGIFPAALKNGTNPESFRNADFPTYVSTGVLDRFTMSNYDTGNGYRSDGFIKQVSGDNGLLATKSNANIFSSNTNNFTFGVYVDIKSLNTTQNFIRYRWNEGTNLDHQINANIAASGYLEFSVQYGSTVLRARARTFTSADTFDRHPTIGKQWIFFTKSQDACYIYINNRNCTDITSMLFWSYGDHSYDDRPIYVGGAGDAPAQYLYGDIYAVFFAENFSLNDMQECVDKGPSLGYNGYDNGDGTLSMAEESLKINNRIKFNISTGLKLF